MFHLVAFFSSFLGRMGRMGQQRREGSRQQMSFSTLAGDLRQRHLADTPGIKSDRSRGKSQVRNVCLYRTLPRTTTGSACMTFHRFVRWRNPHSITFASYSESARSAKIVSLENYYFAWRNVLPCSIAPCPPLRRLRRLPPQQGRGR